MPPPVKDEESSIGLPNTSVRIQQIFSEIQSQLPSVNFDNDDQNDDNEEILESNIPENTDALIESLLNNNINSFLTLHPKIETPQQPPSVELQMRASPNLFDNASQNQEAIPKPSVLSMDLFNSIDFDKLPSLNPNLNHSPQNPNLTPTYHRPRPINHHSLSSQDATNIKSRDDRQVLERLAQQANKLNIHERSQSTREQNPFRNLESALYETSYEHFDRHGRRIKIAESERKTIYIDLRNSNIQKQEKSEHEQQSVNVSNPITQQIQSSESESDDDDDDDHHNDGMLWFEKRQQAKRQQQLNSSK
ncbi:unnamed protein product [Rotaria magnacalcarata]|uniref:Uncharacterized protein n=2 Tax=Rotaria magnacalcarata TaxID=392030 RepID=A0A815EU68_9BILA|nr:unnamed protein product [Rotaria magnacalcarata]CAF1310842.1 unnamed protein product [Rotaria magnacalcarata]CAF2054868.1 unnamed protein product [Rotaria magnacalcarata]CAF2080439.1 unnamed protein product [Rotaria magnacalcarata]CAF2229220.1 unnamed protein product [Rotaria magnacalcarata]